MGGSTNPVAQLTQPSPTPEPIFIRQDDRNIFSQVTVGLLFSMKLHSNGIINKEHWCSNPLAIVSKLGQFYSPRVD